MSEWQKIEYPPTEANGIIAVGVWVGDRWSAWTVDLTDGRYPADDYGCDGEFGEAPTHWHVLTPPPPEDEAPPHPPTVGEGE
jgi:hypothetical protein